MQRPLAITLLVLMEILISSGEACTPQGPKQLGLHLDYDSKSSHYYAGTNSGSAGETEFNLIQCQKNLGKFVQVTLGIEELTPDASVAFTGLQSTFEMNKCLVKNAPNDWIPFSQDIFQKRYTQKYTFVKECVDLIVEDVAASSIRYPSNQAGCNPIKLGANKVLMNGSSCFFSVSASGHFKFTPQIKSACLERSRLEQLGINPQEFTAKLNTYVAGDASGTSSNVDSLGSHQLRFLISPGPELLALTTFENEQTPRWARDLNFPDIHFSKISLRERGTSTYINPNLIVNSVCQDSCRDGLCTNSCSYALPMMPEFSLYQVKNGRRIFLSSWYGGMIAPSNWWGNIRSQQDVQLPFLLDDKQQYVLEANFGNPREDYLMAKNLMKSRFPVLGRLSGTGAMTVMPVLGPSRTFNGIPTVSGKIEPGDLDSESSFFESMWNSIQVPFQDSVWPPSYDRLCNRDGSKCISSNITSAVRLSVTFNLKKTDGNLNLEIVQFDRKSPILQSYIRKSDALPDLICQ